MNESKENLSIIHQILSLKFPDSFPKVENTDEIRIIVAPIKFPNYSSQDLQLLLSNLQKVKTVSELLNGFNYYFPLIPTVLQIMTELPKEPEIIEYCSCYILCSCITWIMYVEHTKNFELLPSLLDCLVFTSQSSNSKLVINTYMQCVHLYLSKTKNFDFTYIFPTFSDLILSGKKQFFIIQTLFKPILQAFLPHQYALMSDDCEEFLKWLGNLPKKIINTLTKETIEDITTKLFYRASTLHVASIHIFSTLSIRRDNDSFLTLCSVLPLAIKNYTRDHDSFIGRNEIKETKIHLPEGSSNLSLSMQFVMYKTFDTTMTTDLPLVLDRVNSVGTLVPNNLKKIIRYVVNIIKNIPETKESIIMCFNSIIKTYQEEKFEFDYTAILLYLFSILEIDEKLAGSFVENILPSPVFNQNFSIFDAGDNFKNINTLRSELVYILTKKSFNELFKLLENLLENPLAFSELLLRVFAVFDDIPYDWLANKYVIKIVTTASILFQKLHFKAKKGSIEKEVIETTRITLFKIIEKTLEVPEAANVWITDQVFMNFFISLVFEDPVSPFVIDKLKKYIAIKNDNFSSFVSAIELLLMHFPNHQHVALATQLFEITNDIIEKKPELFTFFSEMLNCVMNSIVHLNRDELGHKFFIETLRFIKYQNKHYQIFGENQESLRKAIRTLNMPEFAEEINKKLISVYIDSDNPKIVASGSIYPIIFDQCLQNNTLEAFIDGTKELLKYSCANCCTLHFCEVDLFLLDFIDQHKADKEKQPIVTSVLEVVQMISSNIASPISVQKFINLFCPLEGNVLSVYYKVFVNALFEILNNKNTFPNAYIALRTENPNFHINSLPATILEPGFKLSFSVIFEPFQMKSVEIIEFKDANDGVFQFTVRDNILYFIDKRNSSEIKLKNVEPGKLFNAEIEFTANYYHLRFDDTDYNHQEHQMSELVPPFSVSLGRIEVESIKSAIYYISKLSMTQIDDENVQFFNVCLDNKSKSILPSLSSVFPECKLMTGLPLEHSYNIIDSIIDAFEVKTLVLLFAQLDLKDVNQNSFENVAIIATDIFIKIFEMSKEAQQSFLDSRLTGIISHLLSIANACNLTYELYLKLYELAQVTVVEKLKSNIMKRIILEVNIWNRSKFDVFYKITKHWIDVLVPKYESKFSSLLSINSLLIVLQEQVSDGSEIANEVLNNLEHLIVEISKYKFNEKSFILFIGQCITCTNKKYIRLFLMIMKNILSKVTSSPKGMQSIGHYISLLHNLLNYNDPVIFVTLIEVIILAHKSGLLNNVTLEQHFNIIISGITKEMISMEAFKPLVEILANGTHQLLPMCCMMAINIGKEATVFLIDNVNFEKIPNIDRNNLLWISALLGFSPLESKKKLMKCIFNINSNIIRLTCAEMDIVSVLMNIKPSELIDIYINNVMDEIEACKDYTVVQRCLLVVYYAIFFHISPVQRHLFAKMFINSPFPQNIEEEGEKIKLTYRELYNKLANTSFDCFNVSLGIRTDCGIWIDEDLAVRALKMSEKSLDPLVLQFDLLTCCFMFRIRPQFVVSHVNTVTIRTYSSKVPTSLMNYFSVVSKSFSKDIVGYLPPLEHIPPQLILADIEASLPLGSTPKSVANEILAMFKSNSNTAKQIMMTTSHVVAESALQSIDNFISASKTRRVHCRNLWHQLLREMTQPKAHWELLRELGSVESNKVWQRDYVCCYFNAPFKIKRSKVIKNIHLDSNSNKDDILKKKSTKKNACRLVTNSGDYEGSFEIFETEFKLWVDNKEKRIPYSSVQAVLCKKKNHSIVSIEIQTVFHKTYFVAFPGLTDAFFKILQQLSNKKFFNYISQELQMNALQLKTVRWVQGQMSNFDYLIAVNYASGRTFNSPVQYPFLPWVVKDYTSKDLDLDDPTIYRDFGLPIAAQKEEKMAILNAKQIERGFIYEAAPLPTQKVSCFLQRLEPFTTTWNEGTERKHFNSVQEAYENSVNCTEITELIPEFFFFPEFLTNLNDVDSLSDVTLPQWASDPFDFVYKHRKALESPYVTKNLNKWIDLNFGVSMNSPEVCNTFAPSLYEKAPEHPEALIERNGILPQQIFMNPHPPRSEEIKKKPSSDSMKVIHLNEAILASFFDACDSCVRGTIALSSGNILSITVTGNGSNCNTSTIGNFVPRDNSDQTFVSISSFGNFAAETNHGRCIVANNMQTIPIGKISCIATSYKWICVGVKDGGAIVIFKDSNQIPFFNVQTSGRDVVCAAISPRFDLVVVGTDDGSLIFTSLNNGRVRHVINLESSATKISISPNWGLVFVVSQKNSFTNMSLYNVNGSFIRSAVFSERINSMSLFGSVSGFDYCTMSTVSGNIYLFELYYLVFGEPILRDKKDIVAVSYLKEVDSVIITTKNDIVMYPIHF